MNELVYEWVEKARIIFVSYQLLFLSVRTTVHIFCLTILFKSESPAKDFFFNVSVFITVNGGFSIELRFCDNFNARLRFNYILRSSFKTKHFFSVCVCFLLIAYFFCPFWSFRRIIVRHLFKEKVVVHLIYIHIKLVFICLILIIFASNSTTDSNHSFCISHCKTNVPFL